MQHHSYWTRYCSLVNLCFIGTALISESLVTNLVDGLRIITIRNYRHIVYLLNTETVKVFVLRLTWNFHIEYIQLQ